MAARDHRIVAAILVAAGDGRRLGAAVPKAFVEVAGRTILEHAIGPFAQHPVVDYLVIVAPSGRVAQARALACKLVPEVLVVAGGAARQQSVSAGLAALSELPAAVDLVLVHDVARAFVPAEVVTRVVEALGVAGNDAVVPVLPVSDTIRTVDPDTAELGGLVDRSRLLAMQTPQGFHRDLLAKAHAAGEGGAATDDAALIEALGGRVVAVRGDERAFKITVALDLALAEVLARD